MLCEATTDLTTQTRELIESLEQESDSPKNYLMMPPEMRKEEYAKMVNLKVGIIENHLQRGLLPSVKRGKYRMVNTAKLFWDNANKSHLK